MTFSNPDIPFTSQCPPDRSLEILSACMRVSDEAMDTTSLYRGVLGQLEKMEGVRTVWIGSPPLTGGWSVLAGKEGPLLEGFPEGKDLAESAWREGRTVQRVLPSGEGAWIFLPIFLKDRVHGVLAVLCNMTEIPEGRIRFLEAVVRSIGSGLLRLDLQGNFHLLESLYVSLVASVEELLPSRDPGRLLESLCQTLVRGEFFEAAWIGEPGPGGGVPGFGPGRVRCRCHRTFRRQRDGGSGNVSGQTLLDIGGNCRRAFP